MGWGPSWFLIWALLLPSCVVWGQMLRLSGPQSLVKLGCTGWCELKKNFFPPWFDSTSIPHTVVNPLVMPGTQWFPEWSKVFSQAGCWGGQAGEGIF